MAMTGEKRTLEMKLICHRPKEKRQSKFYLCSMSMREINMTNI